MLVSDFYAVYDALDCPQQKCLIHLMRDLNAELLAQPYDEEFKTVVKGFADLLRPMVETVDRLWLEDAFPAKAPRGGRAILSRAHQDGLAE